MRSWLLVFLLALLPLQLVWAGTDLPAALQDPGAATAVHCTHVHGNANSAPGADGNADHSAQCSGCHGSCSMALFPSLPRDFAGNAAFPQPDVALLPPSRPGDLPDRPQWSARG